MKEYSISLVYAICTSLPFSFTGADAKVTVVGFTDTASKPVSLKMAAGAVPFDPRFMLFGKLPGLMSIATSIRKRLVNESLRQRRHCHWIAEYPAPPPLWGQSP